MFRSYWVIILIFLFAQSDAQIRCEVKHYTTENGLSHERGTGIIKDSEGFMWLGSWDGINRFDGKEFLSYKSFPGDWEALKNDRIDNLVEDNNGYFWMKSVDEFYRFNKRTEVFKPVSSIINEIKDHHIAVKKVYSFERAEVWIRTKKEGVFCIPNSSKNKSHWLNKKNRSLFSDSVNFIYQDRNRNVWIGTAKGLICCSRDANGILKLEETKAVDKHLNFSDYHEDSGQLYFSTQQGYLVLYDKKAQKVQTIKVSNKELNAIRKSAFKNVIYCTTFSGELLTINISSYQSEILSISPGKPILSIYEDRTGKLWLEPKDKGAILVDPLKKVFKWFSPDQSHRLDLGNFYSVFEDFSDRVWVSLRGGSFGYYNNKTQQIESTYQGADGGFYEFPKIVYGLYYDNRGLIWLTTNRGVVKILVQKDIFYYHHLVNENTLGSDPQVRALLLDKKERLWTGTKGGELSVKDKTGKDVKLSFKNLPTGGFGPLYRFLQDSKRRIWIGTKLNGVFLAEPVNADETVYKVSHYHTKNSELSSNDVFALYQDSSGTIWVGTYGSGVNIALETSSGFRFLNSENVLKSIPGNLKIRHINSDQSGNIWIATTDGLLIVRSSSKDFKNLRVAHYQKVAGDKTSVGDNDIQYVFKDNKEQMWLCTSGGGIEKAFGDPFKKLTFKSYLRKDGLSNDFVVSMAQDQEDNLWATTQRGLSRFNPETKKFVNFGQNEGLMDASFSEAATLSFPNGNLMFGTMLGYLVFNPKKLNNKPFSDQVVLTNLQINNQDIEVGAQDSIINKNINYVNEIRLKYDQDIISIDFSNLDHRSGTKVPMLYRLNGLSNVWHNDNSRRRATYTNLPPGNYTFEVKATTNYLGDVGKVKTLRIVISPPFWKTWWAYLIYAIILGICIKIALNVIKTFLNLRNDIAVQKKMTELKIDFFTNISHELRTPLTLILNPIDQIEKTEELSLQGRKYISVIKKNAGRITHFMNQWLDLRKVQSGKYNVKIAKADVVLLVHKVASYFYSLSDECHTKLNISSNKDQIFAWIDAEKIDVVLYNLLSNAFKFTAEGNNIYIHLHGEENTFTISVADEGIGVPDDKLNDIFDFYYSHHDKVKQQEGTGIGLAFSKELVKLHNGEIFAENNEMGGLTVFMKIPVGKAHFNEKLVNTVDDDSHALTYSQKYNEESLTLLEKKSIDKKSSLVLLVEDNHELREFLSDQLSAVYRVVAAKNGLEGLAKAKNLIPDLILSDVMMPEMNGIQLLNELKNDDETSHIPVILLTARSSVEHQVEGLSCGADFYITKPFRNEFLLSAINNLIAGRKKLFESYLQKNKVINLGPSEITITSKDEEFLKNVIEIVEAGMVEPEFNIDRVAEKIGMGRTTFYNKFKSLTDLTPIEFVRDMRLQRSKQLFATGETNVATVAYSSGFNNAKYFSTCFKEKFEISPKEYVQDLLKKP